MTRTPSSRSPQKHDGGSPAATQTAASEAPRLITEPADGVPLLTDTPGGLAACAEALSGGTGPVAVDAERASGIRYGQRAFLVQLKRTGSGIWLIDPEAFDDLSPLVAALKGVEWILHASTQDLPCLSELGLWPDRLFDTELAARLAGLPRVGLAAVLEQMLGVTLAKEHSAADWSTRPLPESWLTYAALDVELLVELREALLALLESQGKREWAEQEFEHIRTTPVPGPREDPWRRTSGAHALKSRTQLAVLRELWQARDDLARHRDIAPGRLLPDSAIVAAAKAQPRTVPQLRATQGFHGRAAGREAARWVAAIKAGRDRAADGDAPEVHRRGRGDGPPQPRLWKDRSPEADARLRTAKPWVARHAAEIGMPTENLLTPDTLRRICWNPPAVVTPESVAEALAELGARPWQVEQTAAILTVSFLNPMPV
ncbi:ribonuclease D [Micrococcus sp. HMSC067E09]|uniref:HRDC domain-containing protein n=1 Tax=Micrococcus TaxID=1269 RepID=UPI0008A5A093|nr:MULTISPECIES: HRDC domain-containing protein [Micrococcus]OFR90340.1 ribonuclease D [Micrococcus sp. HMSC067E09]WIK83011.1 HRDC domain-containing protein [Micrococcus lylae]